MGLPSMELISIVEKASECTLSPGYLDRLRKPDLIELFLELLGVDGVVSTVLSVAAASATPPSGTSDPNSGKAATVAAVDATSGGGASGVQEAALVPPADGERSPPVCRHTWNRRACLDDACPRAHPPLCPYDSCEGKQAGCKLFHGRRKRIRMDKRKPAGKPKSTSTRNQGNGSRGRKPSPTLQEFVDFARLMGPTFPTFMASHQLPLPSPQPQPQSSWPPLPQQVPKLPPPQQMSSAGSVPGRPDVDGIVAALHDTTKVLSALGAKVAALTGC